MRRLPFLVATLVGALGLVPGCLDWDSLYGPYCGDGVTQAGEACDDGNSVENDECTTLCQPPAPRCGDHRVDSGEACDDGNDDEDDACLNDCQEATCGDGHLWQGTEGCDDDNLVPGDGCSPTCQIEPPTCGNGQLDPDEPCDDGNTSNEDSCLRGCSHAVCGDGFVRTGVEECDFGAVGLAACTRGCQVCLNDAQTYARSGAHCYEYHAETLTYGNARSACAKNGGYVWTVAGALEASDVLSHLPAATLDTWLSFNTLSTPYSWVTGESNKYQAWATGQPADATLGCVLNRETPIMGNVWFSTACNEKHAFICERNPPNEDPVTHHAYRLRTDLVDFATANDWCGTLGGNLLRIETESEQAQLAKWFSLEVWLGGTRNAAGQFEWSNGQALGYTNFANGQPDNFNAPEDCLAYGRNHFWNDVRCSVPRAAICELE